MREYYSYKFKQNVLDTIDISIPQKNYFLKYSNDAIKNQKELFKNLKIQRYFNNRVVIANSFETKILYLKDLSHSGYTGQVSKCNGYDGVITGMRNIPLFTGFGDCPQLMVVGDKEIGLVHATLKTLDKNILKKFFKIFSINNNLSKTQIGFSPYIFPENFKYKTLKLKRATLLESITKKDGFYFIDLKQMILRDLIKIGINPLNIKDLNVNTYNLSKLSEKKRGYQISHRQASTREGRGGLVLMLR